MAQLAPRIWDTYWWLERLKYDLQRSAHADRYRRNAFMGREIRPSFLVVPRSLSCFDQLARLSTSLSGIAPQSR